MSDQVNALYNLTIEGSRNPITDEVDYTLILPRTLIVPKDSGIQEVYSSLEHTLARAQRFKEPFRSQAIKMAMADFKGLISIGSERGAYIREFGAGGSSIAVGQNEGQPATWLDRYYHETLKGEKGKLKNNPEEKGLGLSLE